MMVWVEDVLDAACSFCLLHLVFAASYLTASDIQLAFLTDERKAVLVFGVQLPLLIADSYLCKLSLQLIFELFLGAS